MMRSVSDRPGIVDMRDLAYRYMWEERAIARFVSALGVDVVPHPGWRGYAPPRSLVVIVPYDGSGQLALGRPWLEDAERLVIIRDKTRANPEYAPLEDWEWQELQPLFPRAELFDWLDAADPAPCRAAIARALEPMRPISPAPPRINPDIDLPASAWVECTSPRRSARIVAAQLAIRSGRATLIAPGEVIDLATLTPRRPPITLGATDDVTWLPLLPNHRGRSACGIDPIHPIAWRGDRMSVYWSYIGPREVGFMSATDHDYPCGPAKKLWGFENNYPVAIAVTPTGDVCAQTFEHDVTITVGMPIGWHRAGEVDVAMFAPDPKRIAYYAQKAEFVETLAIEDLLDEDNRELAAVVVLGPDERCRYAVDLRHRVVRITGPREAAVGEVVAGPDAGYAIFDADHRIVRRGTGTLLGGWFRHATIDEGGWLWREDLATGERTLLDSAARVACLDPDVEMVVQDAVREGRHDAAAQLRASHPTRAITGERHVVAIPGTRNVLELADSYLRVM